MKYLSYDVLLATNLVLCEFTAKEKEKEEEKKWLKYKARQGKAASTRPQ